MKMWLIIMQNQKKYIFKTYISLVSANFFFQLKKSELRKTISE